MISKVKQIAQEIGLKIKNTAKEKIGKSTEEKTVGNGK